MIERLLNRSRTSGRVDDNIVTYEKRYEGYLNDFLPVVDHLKNTEARVIKVRCGDQLPLMRTERDRFSRQKMETRGGSYSRRRSWYANKIMIVNHKADKTKRAFTTY
jgi:hypothetical protein